MTIKVSYTYASPVYINIGYGTVDGGAVWGDITGTLSNQADLQAALNAKVPYSGATGNVNLGEYELKAGQLTLDTSPTGTATVATMRWNDTTGLTETTLKGGSVVLKNGVDLVARVVNKVTPNTTLTKAAYQAVRVSGAQGQRLAVAFAQANNDNNSADTIGLVTETIATNQEGFIMTVGQLEGINTTGSLQGETWVDGDVLYLSPTTAGALTNVKPVAPQHLVIIGYVEYAHANNGKIYVKVMNGWELGELHDVNTTGATNGSVLKYNGSIWVPSSDIDTGITTLNTLTALSQSFATGTSGTDFNISSATSTHTFNLPSASASNRGLLTSADWSTFNGKENVLTFSSPLSRSTNTISIPQATGSTNGFLSSTDWTTFNNKQNALTNPITGTGVSGQVAYFTGSTTQSGSNNLFWDATNSRLGIGTNSPLYKLDVQGTSNTVGIRAASSTAGDILYYATGTVTGSLNAFTTAINATGNVNTTLQNNNTVTGGSTLDINVTAASTGDPYLSFTTSGATNWSLGIDNSDSDKLKLGPVGNPSLAGANTLVAHTNGNISLGSATDSGQRLQVTGDTLLKGSGNTSATTALLVENSDASDLFTILNNGYTRYGNAGVSAPRVYSTSVAGAGDVDLAGEFLAINLRSTTTETTTFGLLTINGLTGTATTGTQSVVAINKGFAPTSGTATYTALLYNATINQTGGANGITRGLYVNPTLTAAADFRAIESNIASGTGRWNLYMNGSADNYMAGNLLIGTTTNPDGHKLFVNGGRGFFNSGIRLGTGYSAIDVVTGASGLYLSGSQGALNHLFINSSGNLGLGVTPSVDLHLEKTSSPTFRIARTGGTILNISTSVTATGAQITTGSASPIGFGINGVIAMNLTTSSNLLIGTNTDTGERLQVTGDTLLKGSGNTSATTALTVQNSDSTNLFRVLNNGFVNFGGAGASAPNIFPFTTSTTSVDLTGTNLNYYNYTTTQSAINGCFLVTGNQLSSTSAEQTNIASIRTFAPTSGTALNINLLLRSTINQTGGANGITRGLWVNPTLTAAADWRSIEWSNSTGWGLYGAGTANNYLAGNLSIGTTTSNARLQIQSTSNVEWTDTAILNGGANGDNSGTRIYIRPATNFGAAIYGGRWSSTDRGARLVGISSGGAENSFIHLNGESSIITLGTATSVRATLDASGNLGLGVTTPQAQLQVGAKLGSGANTYTFSGYKFGVENGISRLIGGEVTGANQTTTGLDILLGGSAAWANSTTLIRFSGFDRGNAFDAGVLGYVGIFKATALNALGGGDLVFGTSAAGSSTSTERMRLDASGNLLVGGTSVYGATITSYATSTRSGGIGVRNSAGTAAGFFGSYAVGSGSGSTDILAEAAGFMAFSTGGSERHRFFSGGNVGLGTTTDAGFRLDVNGTMRVSGASTLTGAVSTTSTITSNTYVTAGTSASPVFSDTFNLGAAANLSKIQYGNEFSTSNGSYLRFIVNSASATNTPVNALTLFPSGAATFSSSVTAASYTINDAGNITIGTTTGTKIGTATSQKIGFWNATPIVQPTTAVAAAAFVANTGTAVNDASTFDGYTMAQIVKALRNAGLLA